jgi:aminoglycoside 6'-N-acetyltransferase
LREVLSLRSMTEVDLPQVEAWLRQPHVARWWTADTTAETTIDSYRRRLTGQKSRTHMLVATEDGTAIGWCQWYLWADYPAEALAMQAAEGEVGIDYAIGELTRTGRGVGTRLIEALVAEVRRIHPGAGMLVDPDAANLASRRVLEKNGFVLVAVPRVDTEPNDAPMSIYRLPAVVGGNC